MSVPNTHEASALHADAVRVLSTWRPPSPGQATLRQDYLDHLAARPDGVWRACTPAHVTASMVVVDPTADHVLLVLHGRIHKWLQPGGHCEEGDASLAAAAAREALEETGLADLRVSEQPLRLDRHGAPCHAETHLDVQYLGTVPYGAVPVVSAESADVRWFGVGELPDELASGVVDSVAAARRAVSALT
ncbi:NUDIX domain-containing protein [Actinopolymorpha sp. NPDC004070]|uniref:NUDIX domain-containing protein n=1 Tax=Actinopolymorpha sp. NPDC004070 TaxID=3154548 RepID=UPI0033BCF8B7